MIDPWRTAAQFTRMREALAPRREVGCNMLGSVTLAELAAQCKASLERGEETVDVVVPRRPGKFSDRVPLHDERSPRGRVVRTHPRGSLARFEAVELLAWVAERGGPRVDVKERP